MLGLPYPLKTVLHEMQRLFIPFGLCSNLLNEVKMYVKARYFLILVLDIIGRDIGVDLLIRIQIQQEVYGFFESIVYFYKLTQNHIM